MNTVVIVELLKSGDVDPTPWPRSETDEALMCTGSARPLEDAFRISQQDLVDWVSSTTGMERLDTYQLISQAGEAPVGNVCDPNYTMVAWIAKRWLPTSTVYEEVHERLRSTAATYLSQR